MNQLELNVEAMRSFTFKSVMLHISNTTYFFSMVVIWGRGVSLN